MAERLEKGEWRRITKCAEGIYLRGVVAGWTPDQIQAEILRAAPMMKRLEARRHAMDWSRQRVVKGIALIMEANGQHCPLRETDVFDWERKGRVPYEYIDYLSQLFRCSAVDLGYPEFSADYRPGPGNRHPSDQEATTNRAQFLSWSGSWSGWSRHPEWYARRGRLPRPLIATRGWERSRRSDPDNALQPISR